jgi:hypothetical protein
VRITFQADDIELAKAKLTEADMPATDADADRILGKVDLAFAQQLEEEIEYMVNDESSLADGFKAKFRGIVKGIDGVNGLDDDQIERMVAEVLDEFHQ